MTGRVYFVRVGADGPIKVGYTAAENPTERMASLQCGCPWPLVLIGHVAGSCGSKHYLHRHDTLAPYRLTGEWFEPREPVIETMASVLRGDFCWDTPQRLVRRLPEALSNTIDVMLAWPSDAEFARDIGITSSHAQVMKVRGSIAADYWKRIEDAATRRGIAGVTVETLCHARILARAA